MSFLRDQVARRRLDLNPLTTQLNTLQQSPAQHTPASAVSANSLSAQFVHSTAAYTPLSAVRQYNPQQWAPSPGTDHGNSQPLFARSRDPEVVSPAPPPYSPPRSQQPVSHADETYSGGSPATRISPSQAYRSSPEPSSSAAFHTPPPSLHRPQQGILPERPQTLYNNTVFSRRHGSEIPVPHLFPDIDQSHTPQPLNFVPDSLHQTEYGYDADSRPPASRRAVSAGAINTPSMPRSRGSSVSRWAPGLPLPPPPPGPPPPQGRSQSMSRTTDRDMAISPPTRRPNTTFITSTLGPVPPTPAGWVDEDTARRGKSPNRGLVIDTSSSIASSSAAAESLSGSSNSGLSRHHAVRGDPKSLRERRSESKSGKKVAEDSSNNPWADAISPGDSTVPPLTILGRRPEISKSTPRSAQSFNTDSAKIETPRTGNMSSQSTPVQTPGITSRGLHSSRHPTPTPPFSPGPSNKSSYTEGSPLIPPKALPTPPHRYALGSPSRPLIHSGPASAPLSRPASRQSMSDRAPPVPAEQFVRAAIERHQAFVQKEAAAASDDDRVRMFADFIVTESRIRRDKYSSAIDAMGSEVLELTRDIFRPYSSRRESSVSRGGWTPESSIGPGSRSLRSSVFASTQLDIPQLQTQPPDTPSSGQNSPAAPPDTTWWNNYKPSLSPIPSMSVSEALDSSDSRGRPSSRWWEVSDGGSQGNQSQRLERSKRESKYMGVPRELREKLQYAGAAMDENAAGPSNRDALGPSEYPPEKVGLHEDTSPPNSAKSVIPFSPHPPTPNPAHLDVSRLVTLPPPYPRHHPAVNNNHPDLTSIRTIVRTLSDFTEVEATKARFVKDSTLVRKENETAASNRRASLRSRISREIRDGNITYADAAQMEDSAEITEAEKTKEASKVEFQLFQEQVVGPLNTLLMDRIERATASFEQLGSKISVEAQQNDPNSTQEEGDEQPELLEKLTLLKWIFEARESLHKEVYDLLSDRNDRYRDMVVIPYKLAKNAAKAENAVKFFANDALQRRLQNEQSMLKRIESFMDIVEKHVQEGVEALLNAFWDIAPDLSRITDKVPHNLGGFQIQIPAAEYDENPSYFEYPMQYLYSLLGHCEKSTYQFIESQTNLLCLLHEVKSGVTLANCRLMRTQRVAQGEVEEEVERELGEVEKDEGVRLTDDLKEKVRCVEELWSSGLGIELKRCKEKIVTYLVEEGGWMEDE
ncbi:hypothetical protein BJ878DRAFT_205444 [Calycina marina]|uniref:Uncharacterized protein n=1 Tax=Calycina marina TaxID=1763456 RepID=A0A9P7Z8J7_9HELO|nr:hypothetical protein BJ878DRAFT_205444 [Calycina marina]